MKIMLATILLTALVLAHNTAALAAPALNECGALTRSEESTSKWCSLPVSQDWSAPTQAQWSRDIKGNRSGIVNLYVHGSLGGLKAALAAAGWIESKTQDKINNKTYLWAAASFELYRVKRAEALSLQHALLSITGSCEGKTTKHLCQSEAKLSKMQTELTARLEDLNQIVQSMPVSSESLCGTSQIAAFEQDNDPLGGRHHLRIFATGHKDSQQLNVWAVVANRDTGIVFDKNRANQGFLNHKIEADADNERDKVLVDILKYQQAHSVVNFIKAQFSCEAPADKAESRDHLIIELQIQ